MLAEVAINPPLLCVVEVSSFRDYLSYIVVSCKYICETEGLFSSSPMRVVGFTRLPSFVNLLRYAGPIIMFSFAVSVRY